MRKQSSMLEQVKQSRCRNGLFPNCEITTWLNIHQKHDNHHQQARKSLSVSEEQSSKILLSPNIEISKKKPSLSFHHFKKYNSYDYDFDWIIQGDKPVEELVQKMDLVRCVLSYEKDLCVMVLGGIQSGIAELCQGQNYQEGLFSKLIASLMDFILARNQNGMKNKSVNEYMECYKVSMSFLVISNDKLHDLLNPKSHVLLKQNRSKMTVTGCQIFTPTTIYDLITKMKQALLTRTSTYPQSMLVIESSITNQQTEQTRYLTLIQWQKSLKKAENNINNHHNNQSLLNLNKCIYELYKFSIRRYETIDESSASKLWAIFRNSSITKLLKYYLVKERKLVVIGCISAEEFQEEDSFQTLNICKNLSKIKFQGVEESSKREMQFDIQSINKKHHTKRIATVPSISQSKDQFVNVQKVKIQLKKLLDQKQKEREKNQERGVVNLMKLQGRKRHDLSALRYKQQQRQIRQQFCTRNKSIRTREQTLPQISKIKVSSTSTFQKQKQMSRLIVQEQNKMGEVNQLHSQVLEKLRNSPDLNLNRSILQTEIKMKQKEIIRFVQHKSRVIDLLREEVKEIKKEQCLKTGASRVTHLSRGYKKMKKITDKRYTEPNPAIEDSFQSPQMENPQPVTLFEPKRELILPPTVLKTPHKFDYLFEKRRAQLKRKILKNREQVNKEYQKAAQNFQQYAILRQKQ